MTFQKKKTFKILVSVWLQPPPPPPPPHDKSEYIYTSYARLPKDLPCTAH